MKRQTFERLAILYSDTSMNVMPVNPPSEMVRRTLDSDNKNETDPDQMAKVVRVRIEIIEEDVSL